MKVIKHGKAYRNPNAKFEVICPICDCQFEYADNEVRFENIKGQTFDFIYCPECHRVNNVEDRWNKEK